MLHVALLEHERLRLADSPALASQGFKQEVAHSVHLAQILLGVEQLLSKRTVARLCLSTRACASKRISGERAVIELKELLGRAADECYVVIELQHEHVRVRRRVSGWRWYIVRALRAVRARLSLPVWQAARARRRGRTTGRTGAPPAGCPRQRGARRIDDQLRSLEKAAQHVQRLHSLRELQAHPLRENHLVPAALLDAVQHVAHGLVPLLAADCILSPHGHGKRLHWQWHRRGVSREGEEQLQCALGRLLPAWR
mmetsp:Transcript_5734/g.13302  ORF Transcript_5734/g.13302 Transcript_5734/m.13302 type:complete len:255 (+) Transcript_5734:1746-2510(+)